MKCWNRITDSITEWGRGGGATDSAEMNAYAFLQTTMCLFQKPEIDDYCSSLFSVRFGNFISRNRWEQCRKASTTRTATDVFVWYWWWCKMYVVVVWCCWLYLVVDQVVVVVVCWWCILFIIIIYSSFISSSLTIKVSVNTNVSFAPAGPCSALFNFCINSIKITVHLQHILSVNTTLSNQFQPIWALFPPHLRFYFFHLVIL